MTKHRFIALDYMNRRLHHVDEAKPEMNWSVPTQGQLHDMQLVGGGRVAVTHDDGWVFHDLVDGHEFGRVSIEGVKGVSAIRFLPDGRVFAGVNGPKGIEILELDGKGNVLKSFDFTQFKQIRQLHRTPEGTWLLTHHDGGLEVALNGSDRILKSFSAPDIRYAYMLLRKADVSHLLSGGYSRTTIEFEPGGRIVRQYAAPQPEGLESFYYSGFQLLADGHLVQANWNGHNDGDYKHGLKLFEFDESGSVVWSWIAPEGHVGSIIVFLILDGLDVSVLNDDVYGVMKAL